MTIQSPDPLAHLRLLTMKQCSEITTYTPQYLYKLIRLGRFPRPRRVGANRNGWVYAEVAAWVASRPVSNGPSIKPADAA